MRVLPVQQSHPTTVRHGIFRPGERTLPEETAIALTYHRETHAVMMATPDALEDFAIGFSLTDGVIHAAQDITELDIVEVPAGIELRMSLSPERLDAARARRRRLAGPTGCGLCGIDSLEEAVKPPPAVSGDLGVTPEQIAGALRAMEPWQTLGLATRATHAAALWHPTQGILLVREDVGRHNALDKLVGAAARLGLGEQGPHPIPLPEGEGADLLPLPLGEGRGGGLPALATRDCVLLLSSRVSVEMVQKACVLGTPILIAVSAPTAHAVRLAEAAGLTLIAIARADGFEVFCGGHRVRTEAARDAA